MYKWVDKEVEMLYYNSQERLAYLNNIMTSLELKYKVKDNQGQKNFNIE